MPRSKELSEQMREKSRSAILTAALELFAKKGFAATTTAEISKKAKVSKGLVFTHFAKKEDILVAIIEDTIHRVFPVLPAEDDSRSPRDILVDCFSAWSNMMHNEPLLLQLTLQLYMDSSWSHLLMSKGEELNEKFLSVLRKVLLSLGSDDPELDTYLIHFFFDGLMMHSIFAKDLFPADKIRDRFVNMILAHFQRNKKEA